MELDRVRDAVGVAGRDDTDIREEENGEDDVEGDERVRNELPK